jgi:multidrug resistance efflux pump
LLRLDDSLLQSQHKAAQAELDAAKRQCTGGPAALDSAQSQYDIALSAALALEQPNRQDA